MLISLSFALIATKTKPPYVEMVLIVTVGEWVSEWRSCVEYWKMRKQQEQHRIVKEEWDYVVYVLF